MKLPEATIEQMRQLAKQVRQSPGATHAPDAARKLVLALEGMADQWDQANAFALELSASKSVDGIAWRHAAINLKRAADDLHRLPEKARAFCAGCEPEDFADWS